MGYHKSHTLITEQRKEGKRNGNENLTVVVQCSGEQQGGTGEVSRSRYREGGEEQRQLTDVAEEMSSAALHGQ